MGDRYPDGLLCVGGPFAGEIVKMEGASQRFMVAVDTTPMIVAWYGDDRYVAPAAIARQYTVERIAAEAGGLRMAGVVLRWEGTPKGMLPKLAMAHIVTRSLFR